MRLLLFGDVHSTKSHVDRIRKKSEKADLLCCIGDISMFETHLKEVLEDVDSIGKPCLMLPGNHEIEEDLEAECKKLKNITYMHKNHFEKDNYIFFCYGSGGFTIEDHRFEKLAKTWEKMIKPHHTVILLTHAPPYGTKVDVVDKRHVGNKSIRKFIEKVQPKLAVCGHLHENFQKIDEIGKTTILNPGPDGKLYPV